MYNKTASSYTGMYKKNEKRKIDNAVNEFTYEGDSRKVTEKLTVMCFIFEVP
jgi:hypothetical protein